MGTIISKCYVQCSVCLVCIHVVGLHVLCSVLCCCFVSYFTDVHTWFHSSSHHTCSRSPINHSPLSSPLFVSKGWLPLGWAVAELWLSSDWALTVLLVCLLVYWFIVSFNTFVKLCYLSCRQPTFVLSVWWWMFTLWNLDFFTYFISNSITQLC